jgi:NADH-quinone oxidoreductase subunit N
MVSVSRPLPVAQEAGVKYFFLGAMSAAVMLFGFSYFYGVHGTTNLGRITQIIHAGVQGHSDGSAITMNSWTLLAAIMVIAGLAFKLAAVPLHFYAGDVYQGAATPVTALLSFVPKTSGMVAMLKILFVVGGGVWLMPETVAKLLWVIAVLTMSFGNLLALTQQSNIKRVLRFCGIQRRCGRFGASRRAVLSRGVWIHERGGVRCADAFARQTNHHCRDV